MEVLKSGVRMRGVCIDRLACVMGTGGICLLGGGDGEGGGACKAQGRRAGGRAGGSSLYGHPTAWRRENLQETRY